MIKIDLVASGNPGNKKKTQKTVDLCNMFMNVSINHYFLCFVVFMFSVECKNHFVYFFKTCRSSNGYC